MLGKAEPCEATSKAGAQKRSLRKDEEQEEEAAGKHLEAAAWAKHGC